MTWARVDENAPHNPKIYRAALDGLGWHIASVCFCNRYLTDGRIRVDELALIFPGVTKPVAVKLAKRMVATGLWDETDGGWVIHDFHEYNPSAEEVRERQQGARDRQRAHRQRQQQPRPASDGAARHEGSHAGSNAVTDGEVTGLVRNLRSAPIRPDPTREELRQCHRISERM